MRPTTLAAPLWVAALLAIPCMVPGAAQAQPVSGLYIGAAGGANFLQEQRAKSVTLNGVRTAIDVRSGFDTGVVGLGSVGYGFGNGWRVEVEGEYRNNRMSPVRGPLVLSSAGREHKYGPMVNVLFDLDIGSRYVFPYVGGGAGYQWVDQRSALSQVTGRTTIRGVDSSFAYQAIAGLSFPIPPVVGLSLTAEYRYFALAGDRSFGTSVVGAGTSNGRFTTTDNYNHSLLLGLRYAFNVTPPPTPVAPAAAAPVPRDRIYLVFFDWDRAELTNRARQVVAEAAMASTRSQVTRIEVAGHADRSGPDGYNMALSNRRAQAVAAELVRQGVPRAAITTQGFGESAPLVKTADGVREPQNRRVEIVLR